VDRSATKGLVGGSENSKGERFCRNTLKWKNREVHLGPRSVVFITSAWCVEWQKRKMTSGEMDT